MSVSDFERNDIRDNEWIYSRLIEQKREEIERQQKVARGDG